MARPERNNVDYFPYLVDEGEKMYYIDQQYGNDGFATFIKILTSLAKTDYHYLDLSKRTIIRDQRHAESSNGSDRRTDQATSRNPPKVESEHPFSPGLKFI